MDIVCVSSVANDLGESPCWDVDARRLCWIDAWKTETHALDPHRARHAASTSRTPWCGLPIGSIAPHGAGGMVAGVKGGFYRLDPERRTARPIAAIEMDRPPTNRLNDGVPEPRFCE